MKESIDHLPKYAQQDLERIRSRVLKMIPQCEMIILFGSYAKGTFVPFDEREEFGIMTSFMSDYDILVVTSHADVPEVGGKLDQIDREIYKRENQVPIQFINDDIKKFQEDIEMGRYFYTEIKEHGILLYDSRKYELPEPKKLNFAEIRRDAEVYFKEKTHLADLFYYLAMCSLKVKEYRMASFQLHQAAENYFYAIKLTYTLKNSKQHNLWKLWLACRSYCDELKSWFNLRDKEERRLFELLKAAYIEARYNSKFLVTRRDCNFLTPKIEALKRIAYKACEARLEWYDEQSKLEISTPSADGQERTD